jgi:hypothetical protein
MKEGASVPSNGINGDAMKHREKAEDVTDETTTANNGNHNDTTTAPTEESQAPPPPLASIRDLFSFADTWEIKLCIAASFCCAVVTGAVYPGNVLRINGFCATCFLETHRQSESILFLIF